MAKQKAKSAKKTAPKSPKRTAAHFHEAARLARRAGKSPEVVRELLNQAAAVERAA